MSFVINSLPDRIQDKIEVQSDGCWYWTGATGSDSYGKVYWQGKNACLAHRVVYEFYIEPIPKDLQIDHLCRVRYCVNPEHLEPVTSKMNTERGDIQSMGSYNRNKTHCPQGHEYTKENTAIYNGVRQCKICNKESSLRSYHRKAI